MQTQISVLPNTKKCSKCKEYKELSCFSRTACTLTGYRYDCKDCCNIVRRIRDKKNKEKLQKYNRQWALDNAGHRKEYSKKYHKDNFERTREWDGNRRVRDAEKLRQRKMREYYKRDQKARFEFRAASYYDKAKHAVLLAYNIKGRCKTTGIEFDLIPSDIVIPEYCPALGIKLVKGSGFNAVSVDRIDNSRGYLPDNIIVVSRLANMIKTSATPDQILSVGNFYKQLEESRRGN